MELDWKESQVAGQAGVMISSADSGETAIGKILDGLDETINKAVSLLSENVKDESRYLIFEWNINDSTLNIVVTDDKKQDDSSHAVKLSLSGLARSLDDLKAESASDWESKVEEYLDTFKVHIRDYLTTSREYHRYSLIAVFSSESRDNADLL